MTLPQLIEFHEKKLKASQTAYESWVNLAQIQEALAREIVLHEETIRLLRNCVEVSSE